MCFSYSLRFGNLGSERIEKIREVVTLGSTDLCDRVTETLVKFLLLSPWCVRPFSTNHDVFVYVEFVDNKKNDPDKLCMSQYFSG